MKTVIQLITIAVLLPSFVLAQYDFEPSFEHPYGLPNPDAPEQITDFAPLIGTCNCKSQSRNPDQTWAEPVDMVWKFKYIMNGMGIQDETLKADGRHSGSIRQFIADSTKWYVHYYSSGTPTPRLATWEGVKTEEGKIVLYKEQKAPNGTDGFSRLTFYDINENGYKWVGEWVDKTETVAFPFWKIDCSNQKKPQQGDKQEIIAASNQFSQAVMSGDIDGIMDSYTADAKIFPNNRPILEGPELEKYWTPKNNGYKTVHHKITSKEVKFFGDYAHDYGAYEGKTQNPDGQINEWQGKYVVVWKKENDQWKMHLDIWNSVKR